MALLSHTCVNAQAAADFIDEGFDVLSIFFIDRTDHDVADHGTALPIYVTVADASSISVV